MKGKSVTSPHQGDTEKAFANFSPIVLVDLLEYLSYKLCLILHLRSPLINTLLLLEQIFFFLEISIATFNKSQL